MKRFVIIAGALLLPSLVFAQTTGLKGALGKFSELLNIATPLVVALALLFFFWGLAMYILNAGNEEKKAEGKNIMIWGIIALFIMVSVFGIVKVLQDTFDIKSSSDVKIPQVKIPASGTERGTLLQ